MEIGSLDKDVEVDCLDWWWDSLPFGIWIRPWEVYDPVGVSVRAAKVRTLSVRTAWAELGDDGRLGRARRVSWNCRSIPEGLAQAEARRSSAGLCCYPAVLEKARVWRGRGRGEERSGASGDAGMTLCLK